MSFAGHVFDMVSRYNQNMYAKSYNRRKITELRKIYLRDGRTGRLVDKRLPAGELMKMRADIRLKYKRRRRKAVVLSLAMTVIVIVAVVAAFVWLLNRNQFSFWGY